MLGTSTVNRIMEDSLRINSKIAKGLAVDQSKDIEDYINEVMHCAAQSFPPGLKYLGFRRATPSEQLRELTRLRRRRRTHELAKSDFYHCQYTFEYEGKLKPRYIRLPYIRPGGIIRNRGASYTVSPVHADNIFTIDDSQIFMPITRSKITFFKESASYILDDVVTTSDVIYSPIFNLKAGDRHKKRHSLLMHYMLARYGFLDVFTRYFKIDVVIGGPEITQETHPVEEWLIARSRKINPIIKSNTQYIGSDIRIAVRRSQWSDNGINGLADVFYIIDNEPDMIDLEHINNPAMWQRLLPRFIKTNVGGEKKAMEEMRAHMSSLDAYTDDLVRRKLQFEGIPCEDIYDIFFYMIKNFPTLTMNSKPATMFGKQLETVRFLMFDVVAAIFKLMFDLVKMSGTRLNREGIERAFDQTFPTNVIERINMRHGEVSTLESATDCLPFCVTRNMVPQSKATTLGRKSKNTEMTNPSYALDASQALISTYLFITKSDPSARSAVNHFIELGENHEILSSKEDVRILEEVNKNFTK